MKRKKYWMLVGVAALLLSACSGNSGKQQKTEAMTDSMQITDNGIKTIRLDGMEVTWIQDNEGEHLMPVSLFSDASDKLIDSLGVQNGIPFSMSAFLVKTADTVILFDTGKGLESSCLTSRLQSLGIAPADIQYIYLTHFHGDHIGGMLKGDSVIFPNAQVYAAKMEYDGWMDMPDDAKEQVEHVMTAYKDRLHLFEFGKTLPGNVVAMKAVGHTPGHTVYQTGKLLIIGDLIHGAALQMVNPEICASFDMDKKAAIESRKYFLNYAKENGLTIAGMHLPAPAFR